MGSEDIHSRPVRLRHHHKIPIEITREDILNALKEIDQVGWDKKNNSIKYDLVFEGKRYPPKIVVKYAHKHAFGTPLDVSEFSGGEDSTNVFFAEKKYEIDLKPKASKSLILEKIYSREDLKSQFKINDATIKNGIFKPMEFSSVWLFVTEEKTPDRIQYKDHFDDYVLKFEGQTQRRTDHLLIDHEKEGNEILVFYRKKRDEFPNYGFKYLGSFTYHSHVSDESAPGPTRFLLYPIDLMVPDDDKPATGVSEKISSYGPLVEGKERSRIQTYYERNPKLRIKAIEIHGTTCVVCGFDFGKTYGQFGEGYIEIHHMTPHASIKGEREIDPKTDLIPVCSNCHRMIHRPRDTWLTINELKKLIR